MLIGGKNVDQIVVYGENEEILAVISDKEAIEKNGVRVVLVTL